MNDKIYDKDNPAPEYTNLVRNIKFHQRERMTNYKKNYDNIQWNNSKEKECTTSKENTTD